MSLASRLTVLLVAIVAWAGIFVVIVGFSTRPVEVVVRSNPPRASVFEGTRHIGETPVGVSVARGDVRFLRLVKKNCRDTYVALDGERYAPRGFLERLDHLVYGSRSAAIVVEMASSQGATLWVMTEPDGAEVYLDGVRVGLAPLRRSDLAPGVHSVRVALPEHFPQERAITLDPGQSITLRFTLESRWEALYRDRIARDPAEMTNYAELAHSYVLRGRFDEAERVLRQGFSVIEERRAGDPTRFINELWQIYTRYYIYPGEGADESLRPACRKMIETALEKQLYSPQALDRFLKQMDAFDRTYHRSPARP